MGCGRSHLWEELDVGGVRGIFSAVNHYIPHPPVMCHLNHLIIISFAIRVQLLYSIKILFWAQVRCVESLC